MILGFTGTRRGMTPAQRAALPSVLATLPERVLHGGARGCDTEFDAFVAPLYAAQYPEGRPPLFGSNQAVYCDERAYMERLPIWVYPTRDRYLHWSCGTPFVAVRRLFEPTDNPLERDKVIAEACDRLLAFPNESWEVNRFGTWVTVRYARAAGKPVTLVLPDGTVREERR